MKMPPRKFLLRCELCQRYHDMKPPFPKGRVMYCAYCNYPFDPLLVSLLTEGS